MHTKKPLLLAIMLISFASAFAQESVNIMGGLEIAAEVVQNIIEILQSNIMLVARILIFFMLISITTAVGDRIEAGTKQKGLRKASSLFGVAVAVATEILAPPAYILFFLVLSTVIGELILIAVIVIYVKDAAEGIRGDGAKAYDKSAKILVGFALFAGGLVLLTLNMISFEYMTGVITEQTPVTPDFMDLMSTFAGWLTIPNVVVILYGLFMMIGTLLTVSSSQKSEDNTPAVSTQMQQQSNALTSNISDFFHIRPRMQCMDITFTNECLLRDANKEIQRDAGGKVQYDATKSLQFKGGSITIEEWRNTFLPRSEASNSFRLFSDNTGDDDSEIKRRERWQLGSSPKDSDYRYNNANYPYGNERLQKVNAGQEVAP